jgi:hypothetical protein
MSPRQHESRREPRRAAEGSVVVEFNNPQKRAVQGRLVDLSPGGFRMAHSSIELIPGMVVKFKHSLATGQARVVWNRILENRVETGFLIT